jgi:hypothetical protein
MSWLLDDMTVDKMTGEEMTVDKMEEDEMFVYKIVFWLAGFKQRHNKIYISNLR